jgi:thiamine biosynthesis lipoprotein ApbE
MEDFKKLLESGNIKQAADFLSEVFETQISPQERGEMLTLLSLTYMKMQASLDKQEAEMLEDILNRLNTLEKTYNKDSDALDLAGLRHKLKP